MERPQYEHPGGPPRFHHGRGGPHPGSYSASSSFDRAPSHGQPPPPPGHRGGPVFSSSYEVPASPIRTGGTPPPMSISADESDDYGRGGGGADPEAYYRHREEYARHGREYRGGDPRDGGRRYEYDPRGPPPPGREEDRPPPGGSVFRGGPPPHYEDPNHHHDHAAAEAERRRYEAGYDGGGYDPRDPRARGPPPPPHGHHPEHYRGHPPPPGPPPSVPHQGSWSRGGGRGTETPPPRSSDPRGAGTLLCLPVAVSPADRAGMRGGDSVASSDMGAPSAASSVGPSVTPLSQPSGGMGMGGGTGKPPTGKTPPPSASDAAGVFVSPPPLPQEARLAGHRRMPCRARSVPVGHTPQTAYLSIPPDAPHGMVLMCSHPHCAASGKRFRFCAVCDIPVAKRNFLKRHSHGLVSPGSPAAQVGQPGAITGREAVAMAKSLGTSSPALAKDGSEAETPSTPKPDADDDSAENEEVDESMEAEEEEAAKRANQARATDEGKGTIGGGKIVTSQPTPSRAPSLSSVDGGPACLTPKSPFSTLSTGSIRPRADSDDSNRSAFGSPVKRARDGGSTPPKDRLRPPESIDLSLPRMHGDDDGPLLGPGTQVARGRPASHLSASARRVDDSPRPLSPPRLLQTCRTFPLPPPHREPRFATAEPTPPEEYYRAQPYYAPSRPRGYSPPQGQGQGHEDACPPTPSRMMVAGVGPSSRPGAALSFDAERHRRTILAHDSRRSSCLSDGEGDIGLNANDAASCSASALTYRQTNGAGGKDVPVHRFRARMRAREQSGSARSSTSSNRMSGRSLQGSTKTSSSGPPGPQDFEPPTPAASVVRLSRKERQWLELLRSKPSVGDVDDLEQWMDRVLDITDAPPSRSNSADLDSKGSQDASEPRALNEVVRHARPRPLTAQDGHSEESNGNPADVTNEGDDMLVDGEQQQRPPQQLPMSRNEKPLQKESLPPLNTGGSNGAECLMDARAKAKRNLHQNHYRRSSNTGLVASDPEESRTDMDATDHSLAGDAGSKGASSSGRRAFGRDAPTPPPMCFADGARSGLAAMFGCGAFLCADDGGGRGFLGRREGGGPCAPLACTTNRDAVDDSRAASRATSPVPMGDGINGNGTGRMEGMDQLDMPAPIRLDRRINSKGSVASSVSMTGSSMVDLLEGTGLMPLPGTPGTISHTPRTSDGEFRYLDNIMMDSPFPPQGLTPMAGNSTDSSDMKDGEEQDNEKSEEEKKTLPTASPRGKHRLPLNKKSIPSLPTLRSDKASDTNKSAGDKDEKQGQDLVKAVREEFSRIGDVSISMNKSSDEVDLSVAGAEEDVELELKEEGSGKSEGSEAQEPVAVKKEAVAVTAS